jgi:hypothetical protein
MIVIGFRLSEIDLGGFYEPILLYPMPWKMQGAGRGKMA